MKLALVISVVKQVHALKEQMLAAALLFALCGTALILLFQIVHLCRQSEGMARRPARVAPVS